MKPHRAEDFEGAFFDSSIVPTAPTIFPPTEIPNTSDGWSGDTWLLIPNTGSPPVSDNYYCKVSQIGGEVNWHVELNGGFTFPTGTPIPGFGMTLEFVWDEDNSGLTVSWGGIKFPNGIAPTITNNPGGGAGPFYDLLILNVDVDGNTLGTYINNFAV